jgi:hypothetical protein
MNPTLHTWETATPQICRLAVPGGWLYQHNAAPDVLVHVPDPTAPHVVWETPEAQAKRERERVAAICAPIHAAIRAHLDAHWKRPEPPPRMLGERPAPVPGGEYVLRSFEYTWHATLKAASVEIVEIPNPALIGAQLPRDARVLGACADFALPQMSDRFWLAEPAAPIAAIIRQHTEAP